MRPDKRTREPEPMQSKPIVFELYRRDEFINCPSSAVAINMGIIDPETSCTDWPTFKAYLIQNCGLTDSKDLKIFYYADKYTDREITAENFRWIVSVAKFRAFCQQRNILTIEDMSLTTDPKPECIPRKKRSVCREAVRKTVAMATATMTPDDKPPAWFLTYMNDFKREIHDMVVSLTNVKYDATEQNEQVKHEKTLPLKKRCESKRDEFDVCSGASIAASLSSTACKQTSENFLKKLQKFQDKQIALKRKTDKKQEKQEAKALHRAMKRVYSDKVNGDKVTDKSRYVYDDKKMKTDEPVDLSSSSDTRDKLKPKEMKLKNVAELMKNHDCLMKLHDEFNAELNESKCSSIGEINHFDDIHDIDEHIATVQKYIADVTKITHNHVSIQTETANHVNVSKETQTNEKIEREIEYDVHVTNPNPTYMGGVNEMICPVIRVKNTGKRMWSNVTLTFAWGSIPVPDTVPLPDLEVGDETDVPLKVTLPDKPGIYEAHWHFHADGKRFGSAVGLTFICDAHEILEVQNDMRRFLGEFTTKCQVDDVKKLRRNSEESGKKSPHVGELPIEIIQVDDVADVVGEEAGPKIIVPKRDAGPKIIEVFDLNTQQRHFEIDQNIYSIPSSDENVQFSLGNDAETLTNSCVYTSTDATPKCMISMECSGLGACQFVTPPLYLRDTSSSSSCSSFYIASDFEDDDDEKIHEAHTTTCDLSSNGSSIAVIRSSTCTPPNGFEMVHMADTDTAKIAAMSNLSDEVKFELNDDADGFEEIAQVDTAFWDDGSDAAGDNLAEKFERDVRRVVQQVYLGANFVLLAAIYDLWLKIFHDHVDLLNHPREMYHELYRASVAQTGELGKRKQTYLMERVVMLIGKYRAYLMNTHAQSGPMVNTAQALEPTDDLTPTPSSSSSFPQQFAENVTFDVDATSQGEVKPLNGAQLIDGLTDVTPSSSYASVTSMRDMAVVTDSDTQRKSMYSYTFVNGEPVSSERSEAQAERNEGECAELNGTQADESIAVKAAKVAFSVLDNAVNNFFTVPMEAANSSSSDNAVRSNATSNATGASSEELDDDDVSELTRRLRQLREMGFDNETLNIKLLMEYKNDMQAVIERLV